jgi:hypothetical protein
MAVPPHFERFSGYSAPKHTGFRHILGFKLH